MLDFGAELNWHLFPLIYNMIKHFPKWQNITKDFGQRKWQILGGKMNQLLYNNPQIKERGVFPVTFPFLF